MSVDALELVAWVLAAPLIIGPVWAWMRHRVDREHDRRLAAGQARTVHELEKAGPVIHERNQVRCEQCDETIDATALGNAQFVSGWSVNRPKGTNGVALQERHQRWLCRWCLDKRRAGSVDQLDLFA